MQAGPGTAKLAFTRYAKDRHPEFAAKVVGIETLDHPAVRTLVAHLASAAWHQRLDSLPGYNIDSPGAIVSLTRALPWYRWSKNKAP